MPRPNFSAPKILGIATNTDPLHSSSSSPIKHHKHLANGAWSLLVYVRRHLTETSAARTYEAPRARHLNRLAGMCLLGLIEAFERFTKELAAVCVDALGQRVLDDRLDVLSAKASAIPQHFAASSFGSALCESLNWSDCKLIDERYRKILADEDNKAWPEFIFPGPTQKPESRRGYLMPMKTLWQFRHILVHNAGVLSPSDAVKLRVLTGQAVEGAQLLAPGKDEVFHAKLFLDEVAGAMNQAIKDRLQDILGKIVTNAPSQKPSSDEIQKLANAFNTSFGVDGVACQPS